MILPGASGAPRAASRTGNPSSPSSSVEYRWLTAVPAGVIAITLLVLAVPHLIGLALIAPAEPVLRQIQEQKSVDLSALKEMVAAQESGLPWIADGRLRTDLGLAYLLIAEQTSRQGGNGKPDFTRAIDALRSGLARSPANPYAWARLAYAEALQNGWTTRAISALRLAIVTAPYEPRLLWSRLRMCFLAWPQLPKSDREPVLQQIRFAWHDGPKELVNLARELGRIDLVRDALAENSQDTEAFDRMLRP